MIIGVSGKIGSGKDTLADYLRDVFLIDLSSRYTYIGVKRFSGKLKEIVALLTNTTPEYCNSRDGKNHTIKLSDVDWGLSGNPAILNAIVDILVGKVPNDQVVYPGLTRNHVRNLLAMNLAQEFVFPKSVNGQVPIEMTIGKILQIMGTEVVRSIYENAWVEALLKDYTEDQVWIVSDMRFPNELAGIRSAAASKGVESYLVRIERPNSGGATEGRTQDHPSETALDQGVEWDFKVNNTGTLEDLHKEAAHLWHRMNNPS